MYWRVEERLRRLWRLWKNLAPDESVHAGAAEVADFAFAVDAADVADWAQIGRPSAHCG
jgi:hypothetical protein